MLVFSDTTCGSEIGGDGMSCSEFPMSKFTNDNNAKNCSDMVFGECYTISSPGCRYHLSSMFDHWNSEYGDNPNSIKVSAVCHYNVDFVIFLISSIVSISFVCICCCGMYVFMTRKRVARYILASELLTQEPERTQQDDNTIVKASADRSIIPVAVVIGDHHEL